MAARRIRRIHSAIIAAASLIVPRPFRSSWKREWQAELWTQPDRPDLLCCCLGALPDAVWLRLHEPARRAASAFPVCVAISLAVAIASVFFPPKIPDAGRLVAIYQVASFMRACAPVSSSSFALWRGRTPGFDRAAAYHWRVFSLAGQD